MRELILGGQKSGKSAAALARVSGWLAAAPAHQALLVATALPHDEEMRQRIARHQADRLQQIPQLQCIEEPLHLSKVLEQHDDAHTLIVVDCLTLWLNNYLMPAAEYASNQPLASIDITQSAIKSVVNTVAESRSEIVLVSNEIGLGVIPLGREVRVFVDTLGLLNQALARVCERVTFMAAGCELRMKGS